MRGSSFSFIVVAALCGGLFAGCEWSSSSGTSSWSGSYDNMNFSGTYRAAAAATTTGSQTLSTSEVVGTFSASKKTYSGKIHSEVVAGSLAITAGGFTYVDNGTGVLVGNVATAGSGTINYVSGAWTFTAQTAFTSSGSIIAVYSYTAALSASDEITSITVSQMGQNLTMVFSNGVNMSGRFTTVNEVAGAGGNGYNAQFEVSSSGNKFVGTLDSTTGSRVINGSWVAGSAVYDINGTAN